MTLKELKHFEEQLANAGYERITIGKSIQEDEYEYYKAFKEISHDPDEMDHLKYQIFFQSGFYAKIN